MFCKLGEFPPNKYWKIGMNFTPLLLLTPENIYWSPPACPSFWTIPKGVCELKQRSVVPQKCEGAAFSGHRSNSSSNGSKQHPKQMVRSHCYISNLAIAGKFNKPFPFFCWNLLPLLRIIITSVYLTSLNNQISRFNKKLAMPINEEMPWIQHFLKQFWHKVLYRHQQ